MQCTLTLTVDMPDPGTPEWEKLERACYPIGEYRGLEGALTTADLMFLALGIDEQNKKRSKLISVVTYR